MDDLVTMTPTEAFREKLSARIRADIGDLMPDEMIRKLVADAINAELYRDTPPNERWGKPVPWIQKQVSEMVSAKLAEAIQSELAKAENDVASHLKAEISRVIPNMLGDLLLTMLRGQGFAIQNAIITAMQR